MGIVAGDTVWFQDNIQPEPYVVNKVSAGGWLWLDGLTYGHGRYAGNPRGVRSADVFTTRDEAFDRAIRYFNRLIRRKVREASRLDGELKGLEIARRAYHGVS